MISFALILFFIPIFLFAIFGKNLKKVLFPFAAGCLLAIAVAWFAKPLLYWYFSLIIPKAWNSKCGYGLLSGLVTGVLSELFRFLILFLGYWKCKDWFEGFGKITTFALGQGWMAGIISWGLYLLQLVEALWRGEYRKYEDISTGGLFWGFWEAIVFFALCIGMTYFTEYGIQKKRMIRVEIFCVLYHSLVVILLYYIPYLWELPVFAGEFVFAILSILATYFGSVLIKNRC